MMTGASASQAIDAIGMGFVRSGVRGRALKPHDAVDGRPLVGSGLLDGRRARPVGASAGRGSLPRPTARAALASRSTETHRAHADALHGIGDGTGPRSVLSSAPLRRSSSVREGASRRPLARRRVPRASVRASSGTPRTTGSRRWAHRSPARTPAGPGPTTALGHHPRARARDSRSRRRPSGRTGRCRSQNAVVAGRCSGESISSIIRSYSSSR